MSALEKHSQIKLRYKTQNKSPKIHVTFIRNDSFNEALY